MAKIALSCIACGSTFFRPPSNVAGAKFCSRSCYDKNSRTPVAQRFLQKVVIQDGCWGWNGSKNSGGYAQINMGPPKSRPTAASRVSWEHFRGPIPSGLHVLHKCDNPECANPDHLFLGTPKDNARDAVAKGRYAKGERHGMAKLTADDVRAIRADSRPALEIAAQYGLHYETVNSLRRGINWEWLQ
jgi:hypothetical protein